MKICNRGGLNKSRYIQHIEQRKCQCTWYTNIKKMKIIAAVDKLMQLENLDQSKASVRLQVSPKLVSTWRKSSGSLSNSIGEDIISLHQGCTSILYGLEEQLLVFVGEWRRKGIPESRFSLICKAKAGVNDLNCIQDFILNMDQTPLYQSMKQYVTINTMGVHTVNMHTSVFVCVSDLQ